jgi:hypothetical protein
MWEVLQEKVPDIAVLMGEARNVFREMVENKLKIFGSTNKYT